MRSKIFQGILDETPKDVEIFVDWYAEQVIKLNREMEELQTLTFSQLMSRLFDTLAEKYPNRPLDEDTKIYISSQWIGNEGELRERIITLEHGNK